MAVLAVTVFVVAYALIASDRINKTVVALGGAAIVLAVGVVGSADVFYSHETGIDWDVIFLLLGMMIIVGVLRQTGVFEYVAIWAAKRAKGSPLRIMILLVLVTAVASALLDNVTTVLLIAPVTLLVCDRLAINPIPFLIAEVFASNIGGAATLVGDPPNIIIASRAGLSFNDFLVNMAPIVIVVMVVFVAMLPRLFRGSFDVDPERVADVMSLNEREAIRDPRLLSSAAWCWSWCSPASSPTRCCTSRRRWWRCSAPASCPDLAAGADPTTCPASSGRRCCSSPDCSSWSAPWSRPGSSTSWPGPRPSSPAATRCCRDAHPGRLGAGVGHHRQHPLRRDHDTRSWPSWPPPCPLRPTPTCCGGRWR